MPQTRFARFFANRSKLTVSASILVGLSILTAWNVTRSPALAEARRSYNRGDLARCLQKSLDHLNRQPWDREAALLAARCFSRLDYASEAEPYFRHAGRLTLGDLQIRAYGLARSHRPERAIPIYNEILAASPANMTAFRRLAAVELAQSDSESLIRLADSLSRVPAGSAIGLMLRGVVHHRNSNPPGAVACFERVLELDPELREMPLSHHLFWTQFADDLIAGGRIDDAGRVLSKAVEHSSDSALMNRLGEVFLVQRKLDDAERCFQKAIERDPGNVNPHVNLSQIALQRRHSDRALTYANQAAQLAPLDNEVLSRVADVYGQLGRKTDVFRIQEALARLPDKAARPASEIDAHWPRHAL